MIFPTGTLKPRWLQKSIFFNPKAKYFFLFPHIGLLSQHTAESEMILNILSSNLKIICIKPAIIP